MGDFLVYGEALAHGGRGQVAVAGTERNGTSVSVTPDPPDVQVGQFRVFEVGAGQQLANLVNQWMIHLAIKQDFSCIRQQAFGPQADQNRADDTHYRIQPRPAE